LFVLTIALMLTRSFEIDSDGMGFGIADILHRVCRRFTPNSLSGSSSFLFGSAVWISKPKFGSAKDIYDASRMRMHCLLSPRFEAVFEDAHLIVFQQHLVILRRCFSLGLVRGPLRIGRPGVKLE
jgi:hypothetical protein